MTYLSHGDVRVLLEAVQILHSDLAAGTLPDRTLRAVGKIVRAEIVTFDGFGEDCNYTATAWTSRPQLYTPESLEVFREYVHQHPLIPVVIGNRMQSAIKMTDYVSQSEFEGLELYNEYFRHMGVRHQMGLAIPVSSGFTFACSVNRWEGDFDERDRLALTLMAPHLTNAIHNSFAYERLNSVIEGQATGVISLDHSGRIHFLSDAAERMLRDYFDGEGLTKNSLPLSLLNWAEGQRATRAKGFDLPAPPFKVANAEGELTVRVMRGGQTREVTLLLEEKRQPSPKMLESLNLTRREAEVLFWLASGRTAPEIAELLSISPRTVQKHTERIYTKLGVETRAAATAKALAILR